MTRPPARCPCCGAPLPDLPLDYLLDGITGLARAVVVHVARRPGLSASEIADHVYRHHPEGGPDKAERAIRVFVARANSRLRPKGWHLSSPPGPGSGYRLTPNA